jgi:hypothetical protein
VRDRRYCLPSLDANHAAGRVCYQDYNLLFDVWYALSIIVYFVTFVLACVELYNTRKDEKPGSKVGFSVVILSILVLGLVSHLIWLAGIFNGFHTTNYLLSHPVNSLSLKLPQILLMAALLLQILVWQNIVESSEKMQQVKHISHLFRNVYIAIAALFFLLVPVNILSLLNFKNLTGTFDLINNSIFLVYSTSLSIGAVVYYR